MIITFTMLILSHLDGVPSLSLYDGPKVVERLKCVSKLKS